MGPGPCGPTIPLSLVVPIGAALVPSECATQTTKAIWRWIFIIPIFPSTKITSWISLRTRVWCFCACLSPGSAIPRWEDDWAGSKGAVTGGQAEAAPHCYCLIHILCVSPLSDFHIPVKLGCCWPIHFALFNFFSSCQHKQLWQNICWIFCF